MDGTIKVMAIFTISFFWVLSGLALFIVFLSCNSVVHFKAAGVSTVAVITSTKALPAPRGGGYIYSAGYIFVPQTNTSLSRSYVGYSSLSASAFSTLAVGGTVLVTYDPHSPSYSKMNTELDVRWADPYSSFFLLMEVIVPVLGFLTAATLLRGRKHYLLERSLVRWGSVASAVITAERKVSGGKVHRTRVTYEFRDQDGNLVIGQRSDLPSKKEREAGYNPAYAAVMDNPTVLYNPYDSSRNLLYPPGLVRCLPPSK